MHITAFSLFLLLLVDPYLILNLFKLSGEIARFKFNKDCLCALESFPLTREGSLLQGVSVGQCNMAGSIVSLVNFI